MILSNEYDMSKKIDEKFHGSSMKYIKTYNKIISSNIIKSFYGKLNKFNVCQNPNDSNKEIKILSFIYRI